MDGIERHTHFPSLIMFALDWIKFDIQTPLRHRCFFFIINDIWARVKWQQFNLYSFQKLPCQRQGLSILSARLATCKSHTWENSKLERKKEPTENQMVWWKKFSLFWRQILLEESIKCENFFANVRYHAYLSLCFCAIYSIKKQVGVSANWKHLNKLRTFVFRFVWQHTSISTTIVIWKNRFFFLDR